MYRVDLFFIHCALLPSPDRMIAVFQLPVVTVTGDSLLTGIEDPLHPASATIFDEFT